MIYRGILYGLISLRIVSYKVGILYVDFKGYRILFWKNSFNKVEFFVGSGSEGNKDGMVSKIEFY